MTFSAILPVSPFATSLFQDL